MIDKNLNYIAALEKAISEKYGNNVSINPKSLWNEEKEQEFKKVFFEINKKQHLNDLSKEKIESDGILISKKLLNNKNIKTCESCKKYSLDRKDDVYLLKYKSCQECYIKYIEGRENRWLSGWRPTEK